MRHNCTKNVWLSPFLALPFFADLNYDMGEARRLWFLPKCQRKEGYCSDGRYFAEYNRNRAPTRNLGWIIYLSGLSDAETERKTGRTVPGHH